MSNTIQLKWGPGPVNEKLGIDSPRDIFRIQVVVDGKVYDSLFGLGLEFSGNKDIDKLFRSLQELGIQKLSSFKL